MRFRVKLQQLHRNAGVTPYRVAKDLGISRSTVHRYIDHDIVEVAKIETNVVRMAEYYGVDWKDVVEVIDPEEEEGVLQIA